MIDRLRSQAEKKKITHHILKKPVCLDLHIGKSTELEAYLQFDTCFTDLNLKKIKELQNKLRFNTCTYMHQIASLSKIKIVIKYLKMLIGHMSFERHVGPMKPSTKNLMLNNLQQPVQSPF